MGLAEYGREDGLVLPEDLGYDEWADLGHQLFALERRTLWWLGDWCNFGERKFADRAWQAMETGYAISTVRAAALVAHRFPIDGPVKRDLNLSWTHHREVVALPPAEAKRVLEEARTEHLSASEVRQRARQSRSRAALEQTRQRVATRDPDLPPTYGVIVADPPWDDMTLSDLCDVEVPADDAAAALLLWVPLSRLAGGLSLVGAWRFRYRANLVYPDRGDYDRNGHDPAASWVEERHELILLGTRGEMLPAERPPSVLDPASVYPRGSRRAMAARLAGTMYPGLAVSELFAIQFA